MDSNSFDLTPSQRQTLTALVNRYKETGNLVKAARIAGDVDRHPTSIRNQMVSLGSLDLVEGTRGPDGGYRPTERAFRVLGRDDTEGGERVTLAEDYERVQVAVEEISLPNVHHPTACRARVQFRTAMSQRLQVGDPVAVGPTPCSALVVAGEVAGFNATGETVLLDVSHMEAPLTDT